MRKPVQLPIMLLAFLVFEALAGFFRLSKVYATEEFDPTQVYEIGSVSILVERAENDQFIYSNVESFEEAQTFESFENTRDVSKQSTDNSSRVFSRPFIDPSAQEPDFFLSAKNGQEKCLGVHNDNKQYDVVGAANLLLSLLKKDRSGFYNQFRCMPFSEFIPEQVRSVYQLSTTWQPRFNKATKAFSNPYIQCVTFIFMVFALAGESLEKMGRTNAADFLHQKYTGADGQFEKFQSGKSDDQPEVGDVVVWSNVVTGTPEGHVGIVIEKAVDETGAQSGKLTIANANSTQLTHEYVYEQNSISGKVTLKATEGGWQQAPDFWLRRK